MGLVVRCRAFDMFYHCHASAGADVRALGTGAQLATSA